MKDSIEQIIAEVAEESACLQSAMRKLKQSAENPWRRRYDGRRMRGDGPGLTQQEAGALYDLLVSIERDMATGRLVEQAK